MKNLRKNIGLVIVFSVLLIYLLCYSDIAKEYAYLGLIVWFEQMIPSLLPFMIFSSMLIGLNLDKLFIKPFSPIIKKMYHLNDAGVYAVIIGFLCGFPMGAKAVAMEYETGKLSEKDADFLLAFVNNIGPVYFLSFVYGNIYPEGNLIPALFLMYGIPLLYGLFLRNTFYKTDTTIQNNKQNMKLKTKHKSFMSVLDDSVTGSLIQICNLGGYMILCNLLVMIPKILCSKAPFYSALFHCMFEISGGLLSVQALDLVFFDTFIIAHTALTFTGISCHLQTCHILQESGLSYKKYMLHKIILCSIVYILCYFI